jgi:hypothetical protein
MMGDSMKVGNEIEIGFQVFATDGGEEFGAYQTLDTAWAEPPAQRADHKGQQ